MFSQQTAIRMFSSQAAKQGFKVAVIGAAGGIGQPLSLLTRFNPLVESVSLYDVNPLVKGVAADVSHVPNSQYEGEVTGFAGKEQLKDALQGADVVLIPAGVPRKPGMTRDDLFNTNATIVADTVAEIAQTCPNAMIMIISNPVNSTVPLAKEVLTHYGVYDPKKLMGVTNLDLFRAETFCNAIINAGKVAPKTNIPVIGGHAGKTIVPILSSSGFEFSEQQKEALTQRIMFGGDEVVQAKDGAGSATLSMAAAAAHALVEVIHGMKDGKQVHIGFVDQTADKARVEKYAEFFACPFEVNNSGIGQMVNFDIDAREQGLVDDMLPDLRSQIAKGKKFGQDYVKNL